jgi:hypothetical protein
MSKYRTARAYLRTRVWREAGEDAVRVETRAVYEYGHALSATGNRASGRRPGGTVRFALAEGDLAALADGWDATFDLGAKVVHNTPLSTLWTLDVEVNGKDGWQRGAVETMVRVAAHELRIPVSSRLDTHEQREVSQRQAD